MPNADAFTQRKHVEPKGIKKRKRKKEKKRKKKKIDYTIKKRKEIRLHSTKTH